MEDGEVPPAGSKRIKSLEDQVERLSEEHTNQTETWRTLSSQVRPSINSKPVMRQHFYPVTDTATLP